MQCIYRINIGDKYYIGSTKNFEKRKRLHLAKLSKGYHPNRFMQNLYNKYGESRFIYTILENVDSGFDLFEIEQKYLDDNYGRDNCINMTPIAGGGFFYKRTPEIIRKQLDTRRKNGNWYVAGRYPKEAIDANKGSKRNKQFCVNMSKIKKEQYKDRRLLDCLKKASDKGRENRLKNLKPFYLVKDDIKYGPYTTQKECYQSGIVSIVSMSHLFSGKKSFVKGYYIEFVGTDIPLENVG